MGNVNTRFGRVIITLILLALCIVAGLRVVVSLLILYRSQVCYQTEMIAVDKAIADKGKLLSLCQKGWLSSSECRSIADEDESLKLFDEMRAYRNNITKTIQTNDGHYDIIFAPNILQMVDHLKPKATLIRKQDIAQSILDDYPYM
jgi:hypothetical protein